LLDDLNLILLADALELAGYLVIASRRGSEAIELARQHAPDLILMDIGLPDISGIEAVRRLKAEQRTRAIPIIAVTAFAMSEDRDEILANGCDDNLSKPFKIADLFQLVERYAQPGQ
jgi:two-component system cell cycle response regulator DivK